MQGDFFGEAGYNFYPPLPPLNAVMIADHISKLAEMGSNSVNNFNLLRFKKKLKKTMVFNAKKTEKDKIPMPGNNTM